MNFQLYEDQECTALWQIIEAPQLTQTYEQPGSDAGTWHGYRYDNDGETIIEMGTVYANGSINFGDTPPSNVGTPLRLPELEVVRSGESDTGKYLYTQGGTRFLLHYYREETEPNVRYIRIDNFQIYTDIENDEERKISDHWQTMPLSIDYPVKVFCGSGNYATSYVLDFRESASQDDRVYDFNLVFQTAQVKYKNSYGLETTDTGLFALLIEQKARKVGGISIPYWTVVSDQPPTYTQNIINLSDVEEPEGEPPESSRYAGTGSNAHPGGQGTGHTRSDPAEFPNLGARNAALSWGGDGRGLTYYELSFNNLNNGVFATVFAKVTDIPELISDNSWNRLLDIGATLAFDTEEIRNCLLSAFAIPFSIARGNKTACSNVAVGFVNCNASGYVVTKRFQQIFDTTIDLSDQGWDDFTDFESSTVTLNLPFVGQIEMSPHFAIKAPVRVLLIGDAYTGNLSYWVYTIPHACSFNYRDEQWVLYGVYTGNCAAEIPIQGSANAGHLLGKIQNAGSSIATGARQVALGVVGMQSGNVQQGAATAGGAADSLLAARNSIFNTADQSYTFRGGVTDTNSGGVCTYHCTLQVMRAVKYRADPEHKIESPPAAPAIHKLSYYKGFVQIRSTDLSGLSCEDSEKEEIYRLLREGVYI